MLPVVVRRATLDDVDFITSNNIAMCLETENKTLNPDISRRGVEELLKDPSKGHMYIACHGEKEEKIGQTMITFEWSDWRCKQIWWIQSVYVLPEYRKQGVFRQLYKHVIEASKEDNACGVRLYAENDNAVAHQVR